MNIKLIEIKAQAKKRSHKMNSIENARNAVKWAECEVLKAENNLAMVEYRFLGADMEACFALDIAIKNLEKAKQELSMMEISS